MSYAVHGMICCIADNVSAQSYNLNMKLESVGNNYKYFSNHRKASRNYLFLITTTRLCTQVRGTLTTILHLSAYKIFAVIL